MTEKTWGVRLNRHFDYSRLIKGQNPQDAPNWFESHENSRWREEGVVIWSDTDKHVETLSADEALRLLGQLNSQDNWKSEGISITRRAYVVQLPPSKRRRKKTDPEPEVEIPKGETVDHEIIHLPPEAGPELIEFLQSNQATLSEMAEQESKRAQEALGKVYRLLLERANEIEEKEIDFKGRSFEWERDDKSRWICHHQSAEGRVWRDKTQLFVNACVKQTDHSSRSNHFRKILEAVEWVEKELVELANEPEKEELPRFRTEQQKTADRARLKQKLINGPFWIDPSVMEPKQLTYQIFIELDAKPVDFKKYETICGDIHEYDHQYLSPFKIAGALNLQFDRFQIDQPFGERWARFRIISLTTYYQETLAAEQAQKTWDQSKILQQFKEGKISRARYGYKEKETGFTNFLGACEDPNKPWEQTPTRNDWMETEALQESLSFALEVTDYRDYLGMSTEVISDQQILEFMHETRTRSKYMPEEVRRESKIWLAQHEQLTSD